MDGVDFATVSEDPNGKLPDSFTICNSMFNAQRLDAVETKFFYLATDTVDPFFWSGDRPQERGMYHTTGHMATKG